MKKFLSFLTLMVFIFTISSNTVFAASTIDIYDGVSPIDPSPRISTKTYSKKIIDANSTVNYTVKKVGADKKVYLKFSGGNHTLNFSSFII
jgi:hypothetical protein